MADFFKFLQQNRPDIGLVDRFDLSEIFDSDERLALSNLQLNPDGLDQIYGLGKKGLTKEDIRTMGGLNKPVIHSLGISANTQGNIEFYLSQQVTTDKAIGEPGKHSFSTSALSDNVIVFQGGLAAKKIEYNFLDENGEVRTTTVPTSRESLFNSSKNINGEFTSASYPGLFRIRRRSHLYELRLAPKLLVTKGSIIESPTDTLNIPVYMQTLATTNPAVVNLQCYSTKNSPLILPVRISNSASLSFSRESSNSSSPPFVYGWELKRQSDLRVALSQTIQSAGVGGVKIDINTAGTICNGVNSLLYIYLDPTAITSANLSGLGLTEQAGQDLGLVGFNALKELDISNNNLSTLPVWLKTLHGSLTRLNISGNSFWNNGIVSYFDWQEPPAGVSGTSVGDGTPVVTLAQVLGYSGWGSSGAITAYDGTYATAQDTSSGLYKGQRGGSQVEVDLNNGFRPFTQLRELNLGPTVRLANPDFSTLFPNIDNLIINTGGGQPRVLFGLVPKLKNNNKPMSFGLAGHHDRSGGSLRYLGNTVTYSSLANNDIKEQFIGQFKFTSFNINEGNSGGWWGGICTDEADVASGDVPSTQVDGLRKYSFADYGTAAQAWGGWLGESQELHLYYRDIALRLAKGTSFTWAKLKYINCAYNGVHETSNKVRYNFSVADGTLAATDILKAPLLTQIDGWQAGWYGKLFSIKDAPALSYIDLGYNNWNGYSDATGREFLLPSNFAFQATASSYQNLATIYLKSLLNSSSRNLEFNTDDLKNLPRVSTFYVGDSYITGKFPTVYSADNTTGIKFRTWFHNCRFRDLSALGSINTGRVETIYGQSNGTGVEGCLLPNFAPPSSSNNTTLYEVYLDGTLTSEYHPNWHTVSLRGKLISPLITGGAGETTSVAEATWTSRNNNNTSNAVSDKLYQSGGLQINSKVMVGDGVIDSNNNRIGRVTQIDRNNNFIYIDSEVGIVAQGLSFRREGQDISQFFNNHLNLHVVQLQSTRAIGAVPTFRNCTNLGYVYLNNNLLTDYKIGTFKNITGVATNGNSTPTLRIFSLQGNTLTKQSIKDIINELHDIAIYYAQKGIRPNISVNLLATKYNIASQQYQNWTRAEIFDGSRTTTLPPEIPNPVVTKDPITGVITITQPPTPPAISVTVPDPLETKFQQLGPGNSYPGITIQLF